LKDQYLNVSAMKDRHHQSGMRTILFILTIAVLSYSCNSEGEKKKSITINPNDIQMNEIVHDSLTIEQTKKIERIQSTFAEVYPVSLEETITNFKRDQNPDSEIDVWLQMANAYKKYLNSNQGKLDLNTKKEVFTLLLSRSMMSEEEAIAKSKLTILNEKEAKEVLKYYTLTPDPIDVIKRP